MVTASNDVVERIKLAPDAGLVKSLGANHTLESAIADLVDNSIDAGASRVSIRLLTRNDRLTQVEVLDNGKGMDAAAANAAMTIGHQREYVDGDLGHFGMGLKAASFGHSDVLTVWSSHLRRNAGRAPHPARRLLQGLHLRSSVCRRCGRTCCRPRDRSRVPRGDVDRVDRRSQRVSRAKRRRGT